MKRWHNDSLISKVLLAQVRVGAEIGQKQILRSFTTQTMMISHITANKCVMTPSFDTHVIKHNEQKQRLLDLFKNDLNIFQFNSFKSLTASTFPTTPQLTIYLIYGCHDNYRLK